jgi:hypothetical protein
MTGTPRELRPLVVFSALTAGAGLALCVAAAMSESQRLLGLGTLCLAAGALAFLGWALAAAGELRRRVRELAELRPELTDEEFAARFFPERAADLAALALVRRHIAGKFEALGGGRFWPADRLAEDLHLPELAPSALADLGADLRRELALAPEHWPGEREWRSIGDVYLTVLEALERKSPRAPAGAGPSAYPA